MLLKDKYIINPEDYEVCEKVGTIGEYDFYLLGIDSSRAELSIVGNSLFNLSANPRSPVCITVRIGEELLEDDFYNNYYNIDKFKTYYIVGIELANKTLVFLFDSIDLATTFQYNILKVKSNNFFMEDKTVLHFEKSRFKKEEMEG